jgi:hypothetical protein
MPLKWRRGETKDTKFAERSIFQISFSLAYIYVEITGKGIGRTPSSLLVEL